MSFVERNVTVSFSYRGDGGDLANLRFEGYRVQAAIKVQGHQSVTAVIKIYGLSLSHMNALSKVPFLPLRYGNNTIKVEAGDADNGMSTVFEGTVIQSWPDMQNAPEVFLRIDAVIGSFESVKPAEASSYNGSTDVAQVASDLAGKMGLTFENSGVKLRLQSPYFWGTGRQQMEQLGRATRIGWIQENGKLAIWPQGGARTAAGTVNVSAETGMVGYPYAVPGGIVVKTLFNRAVQYASVMNVKSDITLANGAWAITNIELALDAQLPKGNWFATIFGAKMGAQ